MFSDDAGYADFGFHERIFVTEIGFLASWWVGFIAAWFLARRLVPNQPRETALRKIATGFATIFVCGFLAGCLGLGFGIWRGPNADYTSWAYALAYFDIEDSFAFVRVAYIHNASYMGGAIGLIVALVFVRPVPSRNANKKTAFDQRL